ncbi:MAG: hypothetical protein N4A33_06990 [Bacteriovoracaceae bacterium]|jgi:hypothetical protein|nr:hypothetical protein [Bacteriovoracaceae bacterium]
MNKIIYIYLLIFSFSALALNCNNSSNLNFKDLSWVKVARTKINSSIMDVEGILCAGFKKGKLVRVHFFDEKGTKSMFGLDQMYKKDRVFFKKSMLPSMVSWMLRKVDPLTIQASKINHDEKSYVFDLKFVENMKKSRFKTKIRLIRVNVKIENDHIVVQHDQNEFDKVVLDVSMGLNITTLRFYDHNYLIFEKQARLFSITNRN